MVQGGGTHDDITNESDGFFTDQLLHLLNSRRRPQACFARNIPDAYLTTMAMPTPALAGNTLLTTPPTTPVLPRTPSTFLDTETEHRSPRSR